MSNLLLLYTSLLLFGHTESDRLEARILIYMVPMLEFKVGSRSWAFEEGAFDESWWITYESLWSNRFLRMGAGWEKREIYENIPVRLGRWRSPWRTRHPKLAAAVKVWDPGDRVAGGQQLSYQLLVVKYKRACMSFLYGCSSVIPICCSIRK